MDFSYPLGSLTSTILTSRCLTSKEDASRFYELITLVWDEALMILSPLLKSMNEIFWFLTLNITKKWMQISKMENGEMGTVNILQVKTREQSKKKQIAKNLESKRL